MPAQAPDAPLPFQLKLMGPNIRAAVKQAVDAKNGGGLVAVTLPVLTEKYRSWKFFEDFSRSNILDVGAEPEGTKDIPVAQKK